MIATTNEIKFVVIGTPQTAGSKKGFPIRRANGSMGVSITDSNPKAKGWAADVKRAALAVVGETFPLMTGPLSVEMHFWLKRPQSHFGSGKNADTLKASAPRLPTSKPDALKLARCVEDALTQVLWEDDAQITTEVLTKSYCDKGQSERCFVRVIPDPRG